MKLSDKGINLIKELENFRSKAYLDTGGVATIGFGTIKYPSGNKVKLGDVISMDKAIELLKFDVLRFEQAVNDFVTSNLKQNQFDALVSFVYNIGATEFKKSTLLKKVNINPNDPTIENEFKKWKYDNGKIIKGLENRRKKEIALFFNKPT